MRGRIPGNAYDGVRRRLLRLVFGNWRLKRAPAMKKQARGLAYVAECQLSFAQLNEKNRRESAEKRCKLPLGNELPEDFSDHSLL